MQNSFFFNYSSWKKSPKWSLDLIRWQKSPRKHLASSVGDNEGHDLSSLVQIDKHNEINV